MLKTEIASLMNEDGKMYEWASKVEYKRELTPEDKEISSVVDAWAKEIGERGSDSDLELSAFIIKTVEPTIYNAPDELLDELFTRGSIGEFDDVEDVVNPENTLKVYDASKGGNVPKSYVDYKFTKPVWKHKQVETEIPYVELRRNGFKTVANLTMFAEEGLKNKMFFDVFSAIDGAITSGTDQYIAGTGANPTVENMDALTLYLTDRGANPMVISASRYAQAIARMNGYSSFMSENMKEEFNRYGLVKFYGGVRIGSISGATKVDGKFVLPDKKIFGVADKIGTLDMRGSLRTYETMDNNKEVVNLKITGFEFGYKLDKIENTAKIVLV